VTPEVVQAVLLRDGADLAGGSDAGLDGACERECNWTVPPTPLSGRVGNALTQLNDSNIVRDVRECQILIHDCLAH